MGKLRNPRRGNLFLPESSDRRAELLGFLEAEASAERPVVSRGLKGRALLRTFQMGDRCQMPWFDQICHASVCYSNYSIANYRLYVVSYDIDI